MIFFSLCGRATSWTIAAWTYRMSAVRMTLSINISIEATYDAFNIDNTPNLPYSYLHHSHFAILRNMCTCPVYLMYGLHDSRALLAPNFETSKLSRLPCVRKQVLKVT